MTDFYDDYEFDPFGGYGNVIRRRYNDRFVDPRKTLTKEQAPYGFSEYFIFGDRWAIKENGVDGNYSDRMSQWDREKYEKAFKNNIKSRILSGNVVEISAFLSEYFGKPCEAVAMAEGCFPNGYSYFIFWHKEL